MNKEYGLICLQTVTKTQWAKQAQSWIISKDFFLLNKFHGKCSRILLSVQLLMVYIETNIKYCYCVARIYLFLLVKMYMRACVSGDHACSMLFEHSHPHSHLTLILMILSKKTKKNEKNALSVVCLCVCVEKFVLFSC